MNPVEQVRVRITVTVTEDFRTERRSSLVERVKDELVADHLENFAKSEVVALLKAGRKAAKSKP